MAAVSYGKIMITTDGEWVDSKEYEILTMVSYLGSTYITKATSPIGTLPTDTNYWQLLVQGAEFATSQSAGVVKPDGESILVDWTGGLSVGKLDNATIEFTESETEENIVSGETSSTIFGKILKSINTFRDGLANKISTSKIVNTTAVTEAGFVPDALLVKTNAEAISTLNNNLPALGYTNEGIKNSIYRGKHLGNSVTASQYTAIASGAFTDLYIGDYWTIGGVNYRIAAFNYYYNAGDAMTSSNHITIVPDTQLYTHVMNDTNITTGAYMGSQMYIEGLEQAKTTIRGIFGTHLLKHRQILSNATADGKASGWNWIDSEVELMNEIMVYGSIVWGGSAVGGSGYNIGVGKSQLPLFALNPRMINTGQSYWLRDVLSAAYFADVYYYGLANYGGASLAYGVRPAFSIS